MARSDELLIIAGIAGGMALTLMLGAKLISPTRFAQALAGGVTGLAAVKLAFLFSGADHG